MATYVISYDLNKQKNYPALYGAIKSFGTWCHPMDSTWLVVSDWDAVQVRNHIWAAMDRDDTLLVTRVQKGDSAWAGMNSTVTKWFHSNL